MKKMLHKNQRKAIRKMIQKPELTPATIDEADKIAKDFGLSRDELMKKIGIEEATPYNIFKKKEDISFMGKLGRYFTISYWKNRNVMDANLHTANLVHMELNNGMHRTFVVSERNHGFYYLKKRYVFDLKMRYYDLDYDMHGYDFHEGFALPFARHFPATDIKKTLESSDSMKGFEVSYAVNPSVLERFVNSAAIEMALHAGELREILKFIKIMSIVNTILQAVTGTALGYMLFKIWGILKPA